MQAHFDRTRLDDGIPTTTGRSGTQPRRLARRAGLTYAVLIVAGVTGGLILRAPLEDGGVALLAETATLQAFRWSLLADTLMLLADVTLALLLFALFRPVSEGLARAAMVFRLVQAALIGASLIALTTLPGLVAAGEVALAEVMLAAHATGYDLGLAFFAVATAAISLLIWRMPGAPRWIAVALGLSAAVYLGGAIVRLAAPELVTLYEPAFAIPLVAEVSFALWLAVFARL